MRWPTRRGWRSNWGSCSGAAATTTVCERMRSTAAGSKRGSLSASRSSSKASSWFSFSVRSVPRTCSRLARICSSIALRSMRAWKAVPSRSPAPSSSVETVISARPPLSSGSCTAPPRNANSIETSGTVASRTNQNSMPAGLTTRSILVALGRKAQRHQDAERRATITRSRATIGDWANRWMAC